MWLCVLRKNDGKREGELCCLQLRVCGVCVCVNNALVGLVNVLICVGFDGVLNDCFSYIYHNKHSIQNVHL